MPDDWPCYYDLAGAVDYRPPNQDCARSADSLRSSRHGPRHGGSQLPVPHVGVDARRRMVVQPTQMEAQHGRLLWRACGLYLMSRQPGK